MPMLNRRQLISAAFPMCTGYAAQAYKRKFSEDSRMSFEEVFRFAYQHVRVFQELAKQIGYSETAVELRVRECIWA